MRRAPAGLAAATAAAVALLGAPAASAHEPGAPYRWVGDDDAPLAREAELPDGPGEVWTGDLQAVVSVDDGPAAVALTPHDAARLGSPPDGFHADGNAYELALGPEGGGAAGLAGRIILAVPHEATAVLFSPDGDTWAVLPTASPEPSRVAAPLAGPGFYLAAGDHDLGGGGGAAAAGTAIGVAAPPLVLLALLAAAAMRRRARDAEPVTP